MPFSLLILSRISFCTGFRVGKQVYGTGQRASRPVGKVPVAGQDHSPLHAAPAREQLCASSLSSRIRFIAEATYVGHALGVCIHQLQQALLAGLRRKVDMTYAQ